MKFLLLLVWVCGHHTCALPHQATAVKEYSSFHECFVAGFVLLSHQPKEGSRKYRCVPKKTAPARMAKELSTHSSLLERTAEDKLIRKESRGNPRALNRFGYAGMFQFGAPLLTDLGLYAPGRGEDLRSWSKFSRWQLGKWSGTFHIPGYPDVATLSDFLANPSAQKAAFSIHVSHMERQIEATGLEKYIGRSVDQVPITLTGIEMMIHLGGIGGAAEVLRTDGKVDPHDANGVSVLDYARLGIQNSSTASSQEAGRIAQLKPSSPKSGFSVPSERSGLQHYASSGP